MLANMDDTFLSALNDIRDADSLSTIAWASGRATGIADAMLKTYLIDEELYEKLARAIKAQRNLHPLYQTPSYLKRQAG